MTRFDDRAKRIREFRIAVMNEVPASFKKAPFIHGDIPSNLHHPGYSSKTHEPCVLEIVLKSTFIPLFIEQHKILCYFLQLSG